MVKGQSAIEYIMTYGWALIVLLLVAAILYALFADQCPQTVQGLETSELAVVNHGFDTDQNLSLEIENRMDREAEVINYTFEFEDDRNVTFPADQTYGDETFAPAESEQIKLPGFEWGTECRSVPLTISYDDELLGEIQITGYVIDYIDGEFVTPGSPYGFNVSEAETNP